MAGFVSPRLGIKFDPREGADNLVIFGPDGTPFLTFTEWVEKSKAEQRRADAAEERAEAAEDRAEAAEERAQRFAAKLRDLGIEPE